MTTWNLEETVHHVLICNGGTCMRMGGEEVTQAIRAEITARNAEERIHTTRTRCNGRCADGCVVIVYPEGTWYQRMSPELAPRLVQEHLLEGKILKEKAVYTYENMLTSSGKSIPGEKKTTK